MTTMTEQRAIEIAAAGLRAGSPDMPRYAALAGRLAEQRGCRSAGPVQIGATTWAYRSANGSTMFWHRRPTAAEVRALTGSRTASTPRSTTRSTTRSRPRSTPAPTPEAQRVGRLFR